MIFLPAALRRPLHLVLILLALTLAIPLAQATDPAAGCGASPGGAPCDGSGPASQGNSSATNQGAGNPSSTTTQRQMTGTGMTYADTEQFITFDPTRSRPDNVTGTVDMSAYLNWLNAHGYGLTNLTVQ